jgi:hypothetical protein
VERTAWSVRVRSSRRDLATAYVRRHELAIGRPVSFDPEDPSVSALETALAALGADVANGFRRAAERARVPVDGIEAVVRATLENPLVHLDVVGESGFPGLERVEVRVYADTFADPDRVRAAFDAALDRSPLVATLRKAAEVVARIEIVP